MSGVCLTIRCGVYPHDAWMTVEVLPTGVIEIVEAVTYCPAIDFVPALEWAFGITLEGTGPIPDGWHLATVESELERERVVGADLFGQMLADVSHFVGEHQAWGE